MLVYFYHYLYDLIYGVKYENVDPDERLIIEDVD